MAHLRTFMTVALVALVASLFGGTTAFAQDGPTFAESFYTALVMDDDDDAEGLEACAARFRAAMTGTGQYQERNSQDVDQIVSTCNEEQASADWVEQCLLESTQTEVDLVLLLSVQSIRRRGFIFQARAVRPMGSATVWGDDIHIEGEDVAVLAAREACDELAGRLLTSLGHGQQGSVGIPNTAGGTWSVIELVDVDPRSTSVNIDGVAVGVSPGQFGTTPGEHVITLTAPGYEPLVRTIDAPENQVVTLNGLALMPADAVLSLTANVAGAEILIDGEEVGETAPEVPVEIEVPPGAEVLEVRREGYLSWVQPLNLAPGQQAVFAVELTTEPPPLPDPVTLSVGDTVSGDLEAGDRELNSGELVDYYTLTVGEATPVRIHLASDDFNAYVMLRSDSVSQDNDDYVGTDAEISATLPVPGEYTIGVTSHAPGETGEYTLEVVAGTAGPVDMGTGTGMSCLGDIDCPGGDCVAPGYCHSGAGGQPMTFADINGWNFYTYSDGSCSYDSHCGPHECEAGWCTAREYTGRVMPLRGEFEYYDGSCSVNNECPASRGWACMAGWCVDASRSNIYAPDPMGQGMASGGQGNTGGGGDYVAGRLEPGDTQLNSGEYYDEYTLSGVAGETIVLDLTSTEFDTYLMVRSPWLELDNDDVEQGNFNSQIIMTIPTTGDYRILVTSYAPGETGNYGLTMGAADGAPMQIKR